MLWHHAGHSQLRDLIFEKWACRRPCKNLTHRVDVLFRFGMAVNPISPRWPYRPVYRKLSALLGGWIHYTAVNRSAA